MTAVVRRWVTRRSPRPDSPGSRSGLIEDVVVMTREAAVDGLPLSMVLDDLRLVLMLGPDDALPVDALRACALEWARASEAASPGRAADPVTVDALEDLLWSHVGDGPDLSPACVVVVRLDRSPHGYDAGANAAAIGPAGLLSAAAGVVTGVFGLAGEHVALVRPVAGWTEERVVALLPGGRSHDDRVALVRASLLSAPATADASWVVETHVVAGHPDGTLAGLREALART